MSRNLLYNRHLNLSGQHGASGLSFPAPARFVACTHLPGTAPADRGPPPVELRCHRSGGSDTNWA